jgi:hypothetical protein
MEIDINKLPLLATRQEVARALGCPDPRSLRRERLKPVARVVVGNKIRTLYLYPVGGMLASMCVNAGAPKTEES